MDRRDPSLEVLLKKAEEVEVLHPLQQQYHLRDTRPSLDFSEPENKIVFGPSPTLLFWRSL
jgi:hypothetical protein